METVQDKNTSNNENFNENPILTIVKDMQKWIIGVTGIEQSRENGYEIICDHYYKYINQLNNVNKNLNETERGVKIIILSELNEGINKCPIWPTGSPYKAHFNKLKHTLNFMETELEKSITEMGSKESK